MRIAWRFVGGKGEEDMTKARRPGCLAAVCHPLQCKSDSLRSRSDSLSGYPRKVDTGHGKVPRGERIVVRDGVVEIAI